MIYKTVLVNLETTEKHYKKKKKTIIMKYLRYIKWKRIP